MSNAMAPLGESTMIWSALVTFLLNACCCIAMTVPKNVQCMDDFDKCRYQCPPGEVQTKYCPALAYKEINNEFCCPGHFRTTTSRCQVCDVVQFMPDVNNCCRCLPCTECNTIVNDTIAAYCSLKSNVVCRVQDDPTPTATSSCPLMEPTTESPTSSKEITTPEVIDFTSTPRCEPQESQSERTSLEIFFFVIVVPFFLMLSLLCLVCIYCCYVYKLAGNDQPDVADREWKDITLLAASKVVSTCSGFRNTSRALIRGGGGNGPRPPGPAPAPAPAGAGDAPAPAPAAVLNEGEGERIVVQGEPCQVCQDEVDRHPPDQLHLMLLENKKTEMT